MTDKITIILDNDGILCAPQLTYGVTGKSYKHFSVNDSLVIKHIQDKHSDKFEFLVMTGDVGSGLDITTTRLKDMNLDYVHCKNVKKYATIKSMFDMRHVIFIGDDVYDALTLKESFISGTVNNAPDFIKDVADYVTDRNGGNGAITDLLIHIFKEEFGIDLIEEFTIKVLDFNLSDDKSNTLI